MRIYFDITEATNHKGEIVAVDAKAIIEHSPREGFDNDKLGALERDLGTFVGERLNDALKKGIDH